MEEKKMTFKTNLKFIGLTIVMFSLPLFLFIAILITSYSETGQLNWSESAYKSSVFFGIISLVSIPGFLLHYKNIISMTRESRFYFTKVILN